jgi:uncharacterized protein (DUF433 family)
MRHRITIDPNVCFGKACIRGTRIWVDVVVKNLADGQWQQEILDAFLSLTPADIDAVRVYSDERTRR